MRELLATGADVEGSAAYQQLERQARNFKMVRRDQSLCSQLEQRSSSTAAAHLYRRASVLQAADLGISDVLTLGPCT